MQNGVNPSAGMVHGVEIENVGFAEVDAVKDLCEVASMTSRKIVDAADVFSAGEQGTGQRRPDEAGNAGDEIKSHGPSIINESRGLRRTRICEMSRRISIWRWMFMEPESER